ncbi:hypothetical protein CTI12_AA150720 [Artemisia annua]|uniref:Uncharacterized protein n=1 Tax=Artemisia annua TaxID=35608 RepID=A0A2U1PHE5_ARTAN|nr:hypothetical protein CTI12_AA150720 [Artemisia annua]
MGKNTWLKRSIAQHAPATGNNAFVGLVPHLVGKVGLVMTSRDPEEMSEAVVGYNLRPLLCSSMDIGMYYIWQFVVVDHLCLVFITFHTILFTQKTKFQYRAKFGGIGKWRYTAFFKPVFAAKTWSVWLHVFPVKMGCFVAVFAVKTMAVWLLFYQSKLGIWGAVFSVKTGDIWLLF